VSSPPFLDSLPQQDRNFTAPHDSTRNLQNAVYGTTPGQLGALREGDYAAAVSSPPYAAEQDRTRPHGGKMTDGDGGFRNFYSMDPANLGNPCDHSLDTFWTASRAIVAQVHAVLKPGGVAVWVVKDYVRKGERVPFAEQWRQLCEAAGFQTLHVHRAWLVEERGAQHTIFGEVETRTVQRKSFFRRLAEKNGSPRIDWETVICMRKPEAA
jgi:hypothetical protein